MSTKKPAKVSELPDGPAGAHGLTPRQLKILTAIKEAVDTNGYPPSMREIGTQAGLSSPASVKYQLEELEKKGFIRRDPTRGRALEVLLPGEADNVAQSIKQNTSHSSVASQPVDQSPQSKRSKKLSHFQNPSLVQEICSCSKLLVNQ